MLLICVDYTSNKKVNEKIILLSIIGSLDAIKEEAVSIDEIEKFLFSPHIYHKLKQKGYSGDILQIIEEGCELEDIFSLLPDKFDGVIYNFVRDEILFGYNIDDSLPASKVLADGFGQCNTKGTLFMALLRACNIPCRIHGFIIDKKLQKGAMTGIVYKNAPQKVFHSWVEVYHENQWYELEGYILDIMYLRKLQNKNKKCTGTFCGYGVAVKDFQNPTIDFNRNNTYIQSEGITQDFGIYDSPDDLLQVHHQEMSAVKAFMYKHLGRHLMNRNVKKIRNL